jgi:hypothetical protein
VVQEYIKLVRSSDPAAKGYYNRNLNDIRLHHMIDFANMPVMQWPSVDAYDAFKRYWFLSVSVLQTSVDTKDTDAEGRMRAYDESLENLQKTLKGSRR